MGWDRREMGRLQEGGPGREYRTMHSQRASSVACSVQPDGKLLVHGALGRTIRQVLVLPQ